MVSHDGPMHRTLVGGHVQRVSVATLEGREVVLLRVRLPGENVHLALTGGSGGASGVGVLDAEEGARLREAMRG
jgi:hypothetical protein